MSGGYTPRDVADALRLYHHDGDVFEVRILNTRRSGTVSGYFRSPDVAAAAIAKWDGKAPGVYITINPVDPVLHARAADRLQERARDTTTDKNIIRRRRLLIDVDYDRPPGISTSDAEHEAALVVARTIHAELSAQGWPEPIVIDSGNGAHLVYRIDLPNDDDALTLVKGCLAALAGRHNAGGVKVDTSVCNAARIAKVPGTMACKGDDTPDRPHRRSLLLSVPERLEPVPAEALAALVASVPSPSPSSSSAGERIDYHGEFDVVEFMARHNLEVHQHKTKNGGDLWELVECPFNPEHEPGKAWIARAASGILSAGCQHESCFSTWAELREHLEPERKHATPSKSPATLPHPPATGSESGAEVRREPVPQPRIAATPDILAAFTAEIRAGGVVGEDRLAAVTYLALTSRVLSRPVSIVVKGPSAAGKSFVTEQVLRYFPASAYKSLSGMSEHALVYLDEPLVHRFLVVYEAAGLSGDLASYLVRSLLSEGRVEYHTVVKGKNGMMPKTLVIEGPTGVLTTTTAISLHPENETRLLSVPASDTASQTKSVFFALASEVQTTPRPVGEWHQLQAWIAAGETNVTIPFAQQLAELVPPVAVRLRRDFSTVLNMTRAHALLHRATRETDEEGRVVATVGDYAAVRALIADLVADEVGATVSASVEEAVRAVAKRYASTEKPVSLVDLAGALGLDKSPAARRARQAIAGGYLRNLEDKRGKPARYIPGEPLPAEQVVLPLPASLECGSVAVCSGGVMENAVVDPPTTTAEIALAPRDDELDVRVDEPLDQHVDAPIPFVSDDLLARAARVVVAVNAASVNLIAKRCEVDRPTAEMTLRTLELAGVVGPPNGGSTRALLVDAAGLKPILATLPPAATST